MDNINILDNYHSLKPYLRDCAMKKYRDPDYFCELLKEALGVSSDRQIDRVLTLPCKKIKTKHKALYWLISSWSLSGTKEDLFIYLDNLQKQNIL